MKKFWKHYYKTDVAKGDILFAIIWVLIVSYLLNLTILWAAFGYLVGNPLSFYIFNYLPAVSSKPVPCKHEPLLISRTDGTPIDGTKCCKNCGLNEYYWRS